MRRRRRPPTPPSGSAGRSPPAPAPPGVTVTASAGVATFPDHAQDAASLVRAADAALYRAKDGGRDRSEVSAGAAGAPDTEQVLRQAVLRPARAPRSGRRRPPAA